MKLAKALISWISSGKEAIIITVVVQFNLLLGSYFANYMYFNFDFSFVLDYDNEY